jgi:RNA polymerase sigma factor (sigma-70 family)
MGDVDAETPVQMQRGRNQDISGGLLRGLRAGSSHAWARLYDQLAPGIHRFAVSCLSGDAETAQDVVVETLAHAARDIARFDPQRSSLSAWIYGIARHRVQSELRWCTRRKSVPAWAQVSFEDLSELADSHDLGARTAARLDAQRRVGELTGLLSDSEIELLDLSAVEELPGEEISRVVGRSEQATRSLLKRAKQKVRRTAIEATLVVGTCRRPRKGGDYRYCARLFSGGEDRLTGDEYGGAPSLSPVSDEIAYCRQGTGDQVLWRVSCDIWKAKRDGMDEVNLTEAAGLGGINEYPRWSPDGAMIAFVHWDEPGGETAGPGEAWVVKADGSEARRVVPKEIAPVHGCTWSPHGLCLFGPGEAALAAALPDSVDLWGRHARLIPAVGASMEWSPDGTRVASPRAKRGNLRGEPGYWRQLLVMEADGSAPRVLVEQFIADAQLDARRPDPFEIETRHIYDWRNDLLWWAGPLRPTWSPAGDKIAFLAALPFDPEQMFCDRQVDAWVYDLVTRRLTKITNAPNGQQALSWR